MEAALNLTDKVALIAGGTGGLGQHIATELQSRGCTVITCSQSQNGESHHISADLRSPDSAQQAISHVVEKYGSLDIVVNAMGVVAFGEIGTTSIDTIEEIFLTNTFGHIFLVQSALPHMPKGSVS